MYVARYGTQILHDPLTDGLAIYDAKIDQDARGYSTMEFTIAPTHPLAGSIALHDSENPISVEFDGELVFRGVATSTNENIYGEVTVTCASELVYLDWVMTRYAPSDKSAERALAELVGIYNGYANQYGLGASMLFIVDPDSQASQVGYADPDNASHIIVDAETSSPASVLSIIKDSIVDPYGAFLRLRYNENGDKYIGIYPSAPDSNSQVIRFGENLTDYGYEETDEGLFNAVYPTGKSQEGVKEPEEVKTLKLAAANVAGSNVVRLRTDSGTVTLETDGILLIGKTSLVVAQGSTTVGTGGTNVTITPKLVHSMPAGTEVKYVGRAPVFWDGTLTLSWLPPNTPTSAGYRHDEAIVYNIESARKYGIKCTTYQDSEIDDPIALLNKSVAMLEATLEPSRSLTIKAVDAALYDRTKKHLLAGQTVRVISEPHGLDAVMYVESVSLDMDDPGNTEYQLGTVAATLSRSVSSTRGMVRDLNANLVSELNNRITPEWIGGLT